MRLFIYQFRYYYFRLSSHLIRFHKLVINWLVKKYFFENRSVLKYLFDICSIYRNKKQEFINQAHQRKSIFFVFRGVHFIDWFVPIHHALDNLYPQKYQVFYVDFAKTLKRIKLDSEYMQFKNDVEERLSIRGLPAIGHFSSDEIILYDNFPDPEMILTSEGIRHETFNTKHRVFLPHGCVVKEDRIQTNIRYNHFFQPSKSPYTYKYFFENNNETFKIYPVGYPKMNSKACFPLPLTKKDKPLVIYAPSLDISLIMDALKRGILDIFKEMKHLHFLIKLHPSFGSTRHYIGEFFDHFVRKESHMTLDTKTSIQDIAIHSSLLIADFGGVGAEYCLKFGKRIIYLKLPDGFESGTDLIFRDHFGDKTIPIEKLKHTLTDLLEKGDLTDVEKKEMRNKVLYNFESADIVAAKTIDRILD